MNEFFFSVPSFAHFPSLISSIDIRGTSFFAHPTLLLLIIPKSPLSSYLSHLKAFHSFSIPFFSSLYNLLSTLLLFPHISQRFINLVLITLQSSSSSTRTNSHLHYFLCPRTLGTSCRVPPPPAHYTRGGTPEEPIFLTRGGGGVGERLSTWPSEAVMTLGSLSKQWPRIPWPALPPSSPP